MNDDTSNQGLGTLLRRLLLSLDGDVQTVYDELGIDFRPRFFPVVQRLAATAPQTVSKLAEAVGTSQPAMTQTLNEMRRAELVHFGEGTDRRARQVGLTPKGRAVCGALDRVWAAVAAAGAELDAELPHPLGDTLSRALTRLTDRPFRDRIKERLT